MRGPSGVIPISSTSREPRRSVLFGAVISLLLLGLISVPADSQESVPVLHALLQSGQTVPPTGSKSFGNAFMTVDLATSMLCYSISYSELESAETFAHFHGPAQPGVNAGILFDISPLPSPLGSPKTGCVGPLDDQEKQWLAGGLFYINIHTGGNPAGEIRGQVIFEGFVASP